MTDAEKVLWVQAQADYSHALKVAAKAWTDDALPCEATPEALQAGAATVLIHVTKLRERQSVSAPAAVKREAVQSAASQAPAAGIPQCPQCGGEMWDNRTNKKNPKGADFTCKQKNGPCVNEKGFKTGLWMKDLPKLAAAGAIRDQLDAASYTGMPARLEEDDGDLPF